MASTRPATDDERAGRGAMRALADGLGTRTGAAIGVAILVGVAIWLRFQGLDHGLPHEMNRDGLKVVVQAELMRLGAWDGAGEHRWSQYPHLLARLVALLPADDPTTRRTLAEHLAGASATWVQVRLVNATAGVLLVPATYALARHFLDRPRALLAAGLIATSLLHVDLSTQSRPHALFTTLVLLSTLAALRLRRKPDVGSHGLAAAAGGLSIGALQSGFAILPMHVTAWWFGAGPRWPRRTILFALTIVGCLVLAAVFYPFAFAPSQVSPPRNPTPGAWRVWGKEIFPERFDGSGFVRLLEPLYALDPLLLGLAAIGAFALAARAVRTLRAGPEAPRADLAIVLTFVLPYLVVFGAYRETAGRYVLPILPFLACLAAGAIPRRFGAASLVLLVVPLVPCAHLARLKARPDTLEEAAGRIAALAGPDETIVTVPAVALPLFTGDRSLAENTRSPWRTIWAEYQGRLGSTPREGPHFEVLVDPLRGAGFDEAARADPLARLAERGARWIVVTDPNGIRGLPALRRGLAERAQRVERISPMRVDDPWNPIVPRSLAPTTWTWPPPCFQLLRARAKGPTIEIHRLP